MHRDDLVVAKERERAVRAYIHTNTHTHIRPEFFIYLIRAANIYDHIRFLNVLQCSFKMQSRRFRKGTIRQENWLKITEDRIRFEFCLRLKRTLEICHCRESLLCLYLPRTLVIESSSQNLRLKFIATVGESNWRKYNNEISHWVYFQQVCYLRFRSSFGDLLLFD